MQMALPDLSGNPKQGTPCLGPRGPELSSAEPYLDNPLGVVGKKRF